jgi:hypothetical protein
MSGEKSVEISRPRSPTIAAAAKSGIARPSRKLEHGVAGSRC